MCILLQNKPLARSQLKLKIQLEHAACIIALIKKSYHNLHVKCVTKMASAVCQCVTLVCKFAFAYLRDYSNQSYHYCQHVHVHNTRI